MSSTWHRAFWESFRAGRRRRVSSTGARTARASLTAFWSRHIVSLRRWWGAAGRPLADADADVSGEFPGRLGGEAVSGRGDRHRALVAVGPRCRMKSVMACHSFGELSSTELAPDGRHASGGSSGDVVPRRARRTPGSRASSRRVPRRRWRARPRAAGLATSSPCSPPRRREP